MGHIGLISFISPISFISLVGFVSLVSSCSKDDGFVDDGQNQNPAGVAIGGVSGYATYFEEHDQQTRSGGALTRTWELPEEIKTDYVDYEGGYQPIAIAFTQNTKTPMMRYFFKVDDEWRIDTGDGIEAGNDYQLYGFIPNKTGIEYSITDRDGANANYKKGAIMKLQNVPSVMPEDLCVVIGAKHGYDKEHDGNNDGTNRLRRGDFTYTAASSPEGNFVFLLFDHLYAALRVQMKVHADYAKVRKIKLKSLKLGTTQVGDATTKQKTDITISLQANDGSTSPITDIAYDKSGNYPVIDGGLEFWSNASGYELTTDFQPFIGHFMPSGITKFTLISTYDVYDKKGNLIREDCEAKNSVLLSELFTDQTETKRGKRYTVNMTIQPTYLYMLSEPDLNNPEVVIN
jgi:hypothetical protein